MIDLLIPIEADEKYCGNCSFMYSDVVYKQHKYCRLFETFLGYSGDSQEALPRYHKCKELEQDKGKNHGLG